MTGVKIIENYREIENVDLIVELVSKQMKVVKGEFKYNEIHKSIKSVLKKGSRAKLFIITDQSNNYAGFAFGNICSGLESGGDYFWINELYVDDKFRGKHYATTLLEFIENWCENNRIGYIACVTGLTNEKAKSLYRKNEYDLNELIWVDKEID